MRRPERRYAIRELAMRAKVDDFEKLSKAERRAAMASVTVGETREMRVRLKRIDVQVRARGDESIFETNSDKPNAKKFVRENRLLEADPGFFERHYPSREEFEESQRVIAIMRRQLNALAADNREWRKKAAEWFRSRPK